MRILLSPHNDDESLFAATIIQRVKPLVVIVTDSFIQERRGDRITWQQRRQESAEAMKFLSVPICFLGIPDAELTLENCLDALRIFGPDHEVFAPALQMGNLQHDIVSSVATGYFKHVRHYATYVKGQHFSPIPNCEIIHPSQSEMRLKDQALNCYRSQLALASTRPHFDAVRGRYEYLGTEVHSAS